MSITLIMLSIYSKYGYQNIAYHKFHVKILSKLIKRLSKLYKIADPDVAMPNVTKMQIYGQLQFLLHKNYNEKSLSK